MEFMARLIGLIQPGGAHGSVVNHSDVLGQTVSTAKCDLGYL